MKAVKRFPFLLSILIFIGVLFFPVKWLMPFIDEETLYHHASEQNPEMFKGVMIQQKAIETDNFFPIYGSSELSSMSQFHPTNHFIVNEKNFAPFIYGKGGVQSLVHFLNLSSLDEQLENKKIVFILSPQWFVPGGIDQDSFASNYSPLHAYKLAFNFKMDKNIKKEAMKRLLEFNEIRKDRKLRYLYEAQTNSDLFSKIKGAAMLPAAFIYKNILEKKDFYQTIISKSKEFSVIDEKNIKDKSYKELLNYAEQIGETQVTNNSYSLQDDYYNKYINEKHDELKNYLAEVSYSASVEYEDLQLVLDLLKEKRVDAIFVSVPMNGSWYDYGGYSKEHRAEYYSKVKKQVESSGFPVLDLTEKEYENYLLKDVMHLGWKGWVYINESMEQHWNKK